MIQKYIKDKIAQNIIYEGVDQEIWERRKIQNNMNMKLNLEDIQGLIDIGYN